jgi:uncharacterized FlaG/YvyC family protein
MTNQILSTTASSTFIVSSVNPIKSTSEREVPGKEARQVLVDKPADPETVKMFETVLNKLNSKLQKSSSELKYKVDSDTGKTVFKVVNDKGDTIIQVPSEELLAFVRQLQAFEQNNSTGVLLDKRG